MSLLRTNLPDQHGLITSVWVVINLFPFVLMALLWLVFDRGFWALVLLILYPIYFIPYGFFFSMPLMAKLFRKPASPHRR